MALTRYNSSTVRNASPVDRLASEIFGQNIGRLLGSDGYMEHTPRVNILENKDEYRVEMQAPGFDKNDLKVEMMDDTLTIRGEHTQEHQQTEETRYMRREFSARAFERSFILPKSVMADSIRAEYTNGVLQLRIPKSEEAKPKLRNIEIG